MNMFLSVGVVAHRRPVGWRRRALLGIESSTRDSTPLEEYSSRESPPLQRVLLNSFGEHRETGSSCGTEGALFGRLERQGWAVGYERAPPLGGPTGCPLLGGGQSPFQAILAGAGNAAIAHGVRMATPPGYTWSLPVVTCGYSLAGQARGMQPSRTGVRRRATPGCMHVHVHVHVVTARLHKAAARLHRVVLVPSRMWIRIRRTLWTWSRLSLLRLLTSTSSVCTARGVGAGRA